MSEAKDARYYALMLASKNVLQMFRSGYNPTESQLGQLEGAIMGIEAEAICGHKILDGCDCADNMS